MLVGLRLDVAAAGRPPAHDGGRGGRRRLTAARRRGACGTANAGSYRGKQPARNDPSEERRRRPVSGPAGNRRGDLPAVLDRPVRFGAAVYGSFLAASVVGVAYETGAGARTMTVSLLGSMLVFWAAHAWADAVGERIAVGEAFRPRDALIIARREWPLVEAAALPTILLALAWAGAWSRETGVRLALAAALVQVFAWGFAAGRRAGGTWLTATVLAAGEGTLAVILLGAERLVR